jgi:hypothetical protein
VEDARRQAQEAARRLAERFAAQRGLPGRYLYGDRPLREPVVREFTDSAGARVAAITRNGYGSLVLNSTQLMFVDVDLPEAQTRDGFLDRLRGRPPGSRRLQAEAGVLDRAGAWLEAHPGWGWRSYRTRAGLRLVAAHAILDPSGAVTEAVFATMGADPLYRLLCRSQCCFRARLTPKHWRCGVPDRPARWPFEDAAAEARFQEWEARYRAACEGHATCDLIQVSGGPEIDPALRPLIELHDQLAGVGSGLPLA